MVVTEPFGNENCVIRSLVRAGEERVHFAGLFANVIVIDPMQAWHLRVFFFKIRDLFYPECRVTAQPRVSENDGIHRLLEIEAHRPATELEKPREL